MSEILFLLKQAKALSSLLILLTNDISITEKSLEDLKQVQQQYDVLYNSLDEANHSLKSLEEVILKSNTPESSHFPDYFHIQKLKFQVQEVLEEMKDVCERAHQSKFQMDQKIHRFELDELD